MTSDNGPPWLAYHSDGSPHYCGVPERLKNHPVLKERGIRLVDSLNPGIVFRTHWNDTNIVVKVLDLETEELPIYERLLRHIDDPANHTVPSEIERSDHPLLIMPTLGLFYSILWKGCETQAQLLGIFYQLVEGVDYLHQLRIAHLDLCPGNILVAQDTRSDTIPEGRVYIIDFDTSRQFELGPGKQPAITLPETQLSPPNGMTHFDPYSWDMYCLGQALDWLLQEYCRSGKSNPRIAQWYTRWLIGDEKGCRNVCHCRPTARTARLVLAFICLMGPIIDLFARVVSDSPQRSTI